MRSDRDQYVRINWDNIARRNWDQFDKCENCALQGLHYDVHSIMHYHRKAFAKDNSKPTIEVLIGGPLDWFSGQYMGQTDGFSALDLEGINTVSYTHLTLPTNREV